jgi:hypothetical protein
MKSVSKSVRSTAYHEAGHAFVACYFRLTAYSLSIESEKGKSDGHVYYQNPLAGIDLNSDHSDDVRLKAETLMIICLAGPVAQRYYNPRGFRKYHAEDDRELAEKVSMQMGGGSKDIIEDHLTRLSLKARDIVQDPMNWQSISRLAEALIERGELNKAEINKLVNLQSTSL